MLKSIVTLGLVVFFVAEAHVVPKKSEPSRMKSAEAEDEMNSAGISSVMMPSTSDKSVVMSEGDSNSGADFESSPFENMEGERDVEGVTHPKTTPMARPTKPASFKTPALVMSREQHKSRPALKGSEVDLSSMPTAPTTRISVTRPDDDEDDPDVRPSGLVDKLAKDGFNTIDVNAEESKMNQGYTAVVDDDGMTPDEQLANAEGRMNAANDRNGNEHMNANTPSASYLSAFNTIPHASSATSQSMNTDVTPKAVARLTHPSTDMEAQAEEAVDMMQQPTVAAVMPSTSSGVTMSEGNSNRPVGIDMSLQEGATDGLVMPEGEAISHSSTPSGPATEEGFVMSEGDVPARVVAALASHADAVSAAAPKTASRAVMAEGNEVYERYGMEPTGPRQAALKAAKKTRQLAASSPVAHSDDLAMGVISHPQQPVAIDGGGDGMGMADMSRVHRGGPSPGMLTHQSGFMDDVAVTDSMSSQMNTIQRGLDMMSTVNFLMVQQADSQAPSKADQLAETSNLMQMQPTKPFYNQYAPQTGQPQPLPYAGSTTIPPTHPYGLPYFHRDPFMPLQTPYYNIPVFDNPQRNPALTPYYNPFVNPPPPIPASVPAAPSFFPFHHHQHMIPPYFPYPPAPVLQPGPFPPYALPSHLRPGQRVPDAKFSRLPDSRKDDPF